jgi:predicted 3-demethylubiquinone-9 3-methyltransferase (glyoxalase superfamily)
MIKQIYTCLWFDWQAKEAADYYCSIFPNSKITSENHMVVTFELNDFKFMWLNGGPMYKFSPATSFVLECETQEEIDYYWEKLGKDWKYSQCGWLDDKYGITWQIIPSILNELMSNPEKAQKVMQAFLKMTKFDIETLLKV